MTFYFICALIIIEGFVTISTEVLSLRQLLPQVGSSVPVTSLIIGIFLFFLALGYQRGGRIKEAQIDTLIFNFRLSAIFLGFGLSYPFIEFWFYTLTVMGIKHSLLALMLYLLAIVAPIVYWLGQTIPILMAYVDRQSISEIGGEVLFLSTLGSFLGAILTSFILFQTIGVSQTVIANCLFLTLMIVLLQKTYERISIFSIFFYSLMFGAAYLNYTHYRNHYVAMNAYASYEVQNVKFRKSDRRIEIPGKALRINNSLSSLLTSELESSPYIEKVRHILFRELKLTNKKILVLGAGGFTISARSTYNNHFTYIDIDASLPDIVKENFLKTINGDFVTQDARQFINQTDEKYDAIILDTFTNRLTIPTHLVTAEFMLELKSRLKDDGVFLMNFIGSPLFDDSFSRNVDRTIRFAFASCSNTPLGFGAKSANIVYVCKNQSNLDLEVYVDDLNRAQFESFTPSSR